MSRPRFTTEEWATAQAVRYSTAEADRMAGERVIAESERMMEQYDRDVQQNQREVARKFEERVDDIDYWKTEVSEKLAAIKEETEALLTYKTRLENALAAYQDPHGRILAQCLENRERRKGIDLVHDQVQKEMIKEREVIEGVLGLLQRTLQQTNEQIRLNRKSKYGLERDLEHKFSALQLEVHCAGLTNRAVDRVMVKGDVPDLGGQNENNWQSFSQENIGAAERQQQNSMRVRSLIDGVLDQTFRDLRDQRQETDRALAKRVRETREAKTVLEGEVAEVCDQVRQQEETQERLRDAILAKEAPLKLALVRLESRGQRPGMELVADSVHSRLTREVEQIKTYIDGLREQLSLSEQAVKRLLRQQLMLEEDIEIKSNTLLIDEVQNQGLRSSISIYKY